MILQSLYELYSRLEMEPEYHLPPPGYSQQRISFVIELNPDGTLFALEPQPDSVDARLEVVPGGDKPSGKVTAKSVHDKVCLLRNDLAFLVGAGVDENKQYVLKEMEFQAFKEYHLSIAPHVKDPAYQIFCRYLTRWDPREALRHSEWKEMASGNGIFKVIGETEYLHEKPAVRDWWQQNRPRSKIGRGECLVTGLADQPIVRLHEPKIRGVQGAQPAGALIVSFDKDSDAFASYGGDKLEGLNAPVSEDAAFKYATALNALLAGPMRHRHRFSLADTTVVFWTERPTAAEDALASFFQYGSEAPRKGAAQDETVLNKLRLFLNALRKGREAYGEIADDPDRTRFYMLGLTGQAKGRLGVRFFHRNTLTSMLEQLRKHYDDILLVKRFDGTTKYPDPEYPTLGQLLRESSPPRHGTDKEDKTPPILAGPLLRSVVEGLPYPDALFASVMRRIHADGDVNYVRACIIAGYLRRNRKEEVSMCLDEQRSDPPYRLGRLFAVLERIQEQAYWHQTGQRLERGIRDSYFSSACMTPAGVFPRLDRLSTHHRRQLPGASKHYFDKMIADIRCGQSDPPSVMNMKEQASFILGYYHQWKSLREKVDAQEPQPDKGE